MNYELRNQINDTIRRETSLRMEEKIIHGRIFLIGYPIQGKHFCYGSTACFIWQEMDNGKLSPWNDYAEIPEFIAWSPPREVTLEDVEQALQIIEGL